MKTSYLKREYIIRGFLLILTTYLLLIIFACGGGGGDGNNNGVPPQQSLTITSVSPSVSATEVEINTQIEATFNTDIDTSTLTSENFFLLSPSGIQVKGDISYNPDTKTAIFTPSYNLAPLTSYTVTISGVKDTSGNIMSNPYSWSFVTLTGFWAHDFVYNSKYFVPATKAGEGSHCIIYLEQGQSVETNVINEIINQFDNTIYTTETITFGSEPNPGIDGNSKIFILLLDIKDGYTQGEAGYIAGYFNSLDEYDISLLSYSNQKELFSMDINPGIAGDRDFIITLAHEFQHMIHWNEKTNLRGVFEETWLDEALSEVAAVVCGYGPDYSRVIGYEMQPWDSLTGWDETISDYSTVYMWAQYINDRVTITDNDGKNIFWNINHTPNIGIEAVNTALNAVSYGKDFTDIFRDWSIANYLGLTSIAGHPEWSYTSIHTEAGFPTEYGELPGLPVNDIEHVNATTVGGLHMWGVDYFQFTNSGQGTVIWTKTESTDEAAFINTDSNTVTFSMENGTPYTYTNTGILIARNPTETEKWYQTGGGTMTHSSLRDKAFKQAYTTKKLLSYETKKNILPKTILLRISADPVAKAILERKGNPLPICVDRFFREKEKMLRLRK